MHSSKLSTKQIQTPLPCTALVVVGPASVSSIDITQLLRRVGTAGVLNVGSLRPLLVTEGRLLSTKLPVDVVFEEIYTRRPDQIFLHPNRLQWIKRDLPHFMRSCVNENAIYGRRLIVDEDVPDDIIVFTDAVHRIHHVIIFDTSAGKV